MDKKICIITGANAGIGKQAAIQIANEVYHVIIACRNKQRGEVALQEIKAASTSNVELMIGDMSLKSSIKEFAKAVQDKYKRIDVLIHNAAVFDISQKEPKTTEEGFESIWMTNHVGPVYLTDLLLPLIEKSDDGRILTVSSKGLLAKPMLKVDLNDPEFKDRKFTVTNAYYQAKRAQVMYTYWLAKRLKDKNITVNCIRVTSVKVDLARHPDISSFMKWMYKQKSKSALSPEEMAVTYTYLATDSKVKGVSGKSFDENCKEVQSNKYSRDWDNIEKVMKLTYKYI